VKPEPEPDTPDQPSVPEEPQEEPQADAKADEPEKAEPDAAQAETDKPGAEPEEPKPEPEKAEPEKAESEEPETEDDSKPSIPSIPSAELASEPGARGRRTAALVMAAVALVAAAWFGWSWYGAAHDDSLQYSQSRDEVLRVGEQAVQNLNTLDYRSLDSGLKLWQDSSTNELYQEIVRGRTEFERAVKQAKTVTSAKVLDAAVTELDEHAGKASVIVGLQITVTPPQGDPAIKKTRLMGELTRTSTGWKLSALAQAPVAGNG
jgi:Mce-associated membrane protein